jgi:hypothetical protein
MYTITIDENGSRRDFIATKEQVAKIEAVLIPKVKIPKPPQLPYKDLGSEDFGNDIFDDDGNIDFGCIEDCLYDCDYLRWSDSTGEKDNSKPFRLLINNKYLIEFIVKRGDCVEATWDSRIWDADCTSIVLISTNESVPDVEKRVIVPPVPPAPIVLAPDEMMLFGKPTKILNICQCTSAKSIPHKVYPMSDTQKVPNITYGQNLYDVRELERTLIFKLDKNDEHYFMTVEKDWVEPAKYRNI